MNFRDHPKHQGICDPRSRVEFFNILGGHMHMFCILNNSQPSVLLINLFQYRLPTQSEAEHDRLTIAIHWYPFDREYPECLGETMGVQALPWFLRSPLYYIGPPNPTQTRIINKCETWGPDRHCCRACAAKYVWVRRGRYSARACKDPLRTSCRIQRE